MALELTTSYLKDSIAVFRQYKKLGDGAIGQCPDEFLATTLDPESNSVAILVKHLAGNMRSRWTDFLTSDGEKPDRDRDREFERDAGDTYDSLMERWHDGWARLFGTLASLAVEDLTR